MTSTIKFFYDKVDKAKKHFPDLNIKYKDESMLMFFMSKVLFFNKDFNSYTTTIGSTVYFPSNIYVDNSPTRSTTLLMHELYHIYSSKKKGKFYFSLLYLFPQILALLSVPVFFLFGLIKSLFCLLFLLPFPSYTRMIEERNAYIISLYTINKYNSNYTDFDILDNQKKYLVENFLNSSYYWMWPSKKIIKYFDDIVIKIKNNEKPVCDADFYVIVDDILIP